MGCAGYCNASGGLYWCLWCVQDIVMHQVVYMYIGVYEGVQDSVMHQVVYMYNVVYGDVQDSVMHQVVYMYISVYGVCRIV